MAEERKRIFIVDGYGQIYRSYFAFITNPLKDKDGNNVSAVYGFFNTLMSLVRQYKPEYLVVAMDSKGKTFRHEMYDQYKANREKTPEDLHAQIPVIASILDGMHIPHFEQVGMEADDIIATIARKASSDGLETVMVTGDKDLLQLVRDDVKALRPPRKGEKEYRLCGTDEVQELFGVSPSQIVDYLTILGDSSDNVPGINGIGEKGAVKLLSEYGTLDNVYNNIESLSKGLAAKLEAAKDHIELSHKLVMLKDDVFDDDSLDFSSFSVSGIDWEKGVALFKEIGSETLAKAARRMADASGFSLVSQDEEASQDTETAAPEPETESADATAGEIGAVLEKLADDSVIAMDLMLSGEDDMTAGMQKIGVAADGRKRYVAEPSEEFKDVLRRNLPRLRLAGQNLKTVCKVLKRWGIADIRPYFDTMLADWLLDSARTKFDAEDCCMSLGRIQKLEAELSSKGLLDIFRTMEMPLSSVLCDMELAGIELDSDKLKVFGQDLEKEIASIQQDIYTLCGKSFNLNSPKQLQEVLFVDRNLPTGKKTKSGFSTDSDVLEDLAATTEDPVPALILKYRLASKLQSTYVQTLPELVNPDTGRVHTTFLQTGTATGRLSSKNPNLQNIPIRTDDGRRIRAAFVPGKGCTLMSADYSQIELVVLAHLSDDANLKDAFIRGNDIHRETAALIHGVFPEMVTPAQRRTAKAINFGIMYGMSAFRLAHDIKISRKEAQSFIERYFEQYSSVASFIDRVHEQAKENGYVRTAMGHIRYIPEMKSSNKAVRSAAERVAINTVIQGTAAEIMKLAMISIRDEMEKRKMRSRMLLQVHDEVIFEVVLGEEQEMESLVRSCMEGAYKLSVPLRASIEFGSSWGEMH